VDDLDTTTPQIQMESSQLSETKRKAGRPKGSTKTKSTEESWVDKLVRLYEEGADDTEVCKSLKLSYNEFDKRYKSDELFRELVDYGRLAARAWWLELGRRGAKDGKINFSVWYAVMKNRFGWTDRSEVRTGEGPKPINQMSQDEIISELVQRRDVLSKVLSPRNVALASNAIDGSESEH
jgi:hypothetical protein